MRIKSLDQCSPALRQRLEAQLAASAAPKRPKYGNVRTEFDGQTFDSKGEAAYDQTLMQQQAAGEIGGYARQVSIPLLARKASGGRQKRMQIDWLVNAPKPHTCSKCGQVDQIMMLVLRDFKGMVTADWITKAQVLEAQLGIRIEIVRH